MCWTVLGRVRVCLRAAQDLTQCQAVDLLEFLHILLPLGVWLPAAYGAWLVTGVGPLHACHPAVRSAHKRNGGALVVTHMQRSRATTSGISDQLVNSREDGAPGYNGTWQMETLQSPSMCATSAHHPACVAFSAPSSTVTSAIDPSSIATTRRRSDSIRAISTRASSHGGVSCCLHTCGAS